MEHTLTRGQLLRRAGAAGALASIGLPGLARAGGDALDYDAATDTLTWALPATIRSLDFVHSYDSGTTAVVGLGLEGLLVYDDRGALKPRLARAWSHPDPLTYVYRLRKGVKWWDGTPFTADDVVFSRDSTRTRRSARRSRRSTRTSARSRRPRRTRSRSR